MKPTAMLTGSTGYAGQNLLRFWFQQGDWDVVCVDRSTGFDFADHGWEARLPERDVDVVVHLAQSRRYREFPASAQDMFRVNVAGTAALLEWARRHRVKRFLFASTGTVYVPRAGKLTESAECAPTSMYAATKLCAELLMQPYSDFFEVVIARLFGVYGPGQRQMLIADTIRKVRAGQEILLAGGVGIYLTPLFIDDCVKVLSALAVVPLEKACTVVNVAGDDLLSLGEIIHEIADQLQIRPVIKAMDGLPTYLCGDNARLKAFYRDALLPFRTGLAFMLRSGG
jgi:nucleoside-diphosphate-sugar epimerase